LIIKKWKWFYIIRKKSLRRKYLLNLKELGYDNLELSILGIFDVMGYLLISMSLLKKERIDINSKLYFFISATIAMAAITFLFPENMQFF
jgi:hypothetical protein